MLIKALCIKRRASEQWTKDSLRRTIGASCQAFDCADMKVLISLVCCCAALVSIGPRLASGHIHSHKVKHYEQDRVNVYTWIYSLLSSAAVGACGVFPLLVNRWIQLDSGCKDKAAFRTLLSFAVGGLLGDVFLHLLPEAWGSHDRQVGISLGLWVTVGLLSFMLVEKIVKLTEEATSVAEKKECGGASPLGRGCVVAADDPQQSANGCSPHLANGAVKNGVEKTKNGYARVNGLSGDHFAQRANGSSVSMKSLPVGQPGEIACESRCSRQLNGEWPAGVTRLCHHATLTPDTIQTESCKSKWLQKDISGYLNLVANCTDNFTHGLAIATSYVANPAVGLLTTLAILCHEIPHEIGDFAILLNSGFNLKEAAKAQVSTACGGLVGVVAGLTAEHLSNASDWLLPFTAGGFLYIALISIIPDLLKDSAKVSLKQALVEVVAVVMGIIVMAMVTIVEKKSCGHMPLHLKH